MPHVGFEVGYNVAYCTYIVITMWLCFVSEMQEKTGIR